MRITKLRLKNFIGVKAGTGRDEIEIDFPENSNKITLLSGKNGSGKTTILSQLQPFKDSLDDRKNLIVPDTDGEKEIWYENAGHIYKIIHKYGKRQYSYISKDGVELNVNGSVRQFEDIVKTELGVTKDYFSIGRLGSNMHNFIELPTMERKNYIMTFIDAVQKYIDAHDVVSDKLFFINKQMAQLAASAKGYDDINKINSDINDIKTKIDGLQQNITSAASIIGGLDANISSFTAANAGVNYSDLKTSLSSKETLHKSYVESMKSFVIAHGSMNEKDVSMAIAGFNTEYQAKTADIATDNANLSSLKTKVVELDNNIAKDTAQISGIAVIDGATLKSNIDKTNASVAAYDAKFKNDPVHDLVVGKEQDALLYSDSLDKLLLQLSNSFIVLNDISFDGVNKNHQLLFADPKKFTDDMAAYQVKLSQDKVAEQNNNDELKRAYDGVTCQMSNFASPVHCASAVKSANTPSMADLQNELDELQKDINDSTAKIKILDNKIDGMTDTRLEMSKVIQSLVAVNSKHNFVLQYLISTYGKLSFILSQNDVSVLKNIKETVKANIQSAVGDITEYENEKLLLQTYTQQYNAYLENEKSRKYFNDDIALCNSKKTTINNEIFSINTAISKKQAEALDLSNKITEYTLYRSGLMDDGTISQEIASLKTTIDAYESNAKNITSLNTQKSAENAVLVQLKDTLADNNTSLNSLTAAQVTVNNINTQLNDLMQKKKIFTDVDTCLNPKTGIPKIFLQAYLGTVEETANSLLNIAYNGKFSIHFDLNGSDFFIRVVSGVNKIDDITLASQGEISMTTISLSLALIQMAIGNYKILSLDEIDGPLDSNNRDAFINILNAQIKVIGIDQVFVISHNNSFDTCPMNLIILKDSPVNTEDTAYMSNKTVLFNVAK
jgi:DNA repair exonuclease SbcCD ATPase subunit